MPESVKKNLKQEVDRLQRELEATKAALADANAEIHLLEKGEGVYSEVAKLKKDLETTKNALENANAELHLLEKEVCLYTEINKSAGLDNLLDILGVQIKAIPEIDGYSIYLVDPEHTCLICEKIMLPEEFKGIEKTCLKYKYHLDNQDAIIIAYKNRQTLFVNSQNIDEFPEARTKYSRWKMHGVAYIPLMYGVSTPIGVLQIFSQTKEIDSATANLADGCSKFFCSQLKNSMRIAELETMEISLKSAQDEQKKFLEFIERGNNLTRVDEVYEHFTREMLVRYKFDLAGIVMRVGDNLVAQKNMVVDKKYDAILKEWDNYFKVVTFNINPYDGGTAAAFCQKTLLMFHDVMEILDLPMSDKDRLALKILRTPRTFILVPIIRNEDVVGVVWLVTLEDTLDVSDNDLAVIKLLGRFLGAIIENAETYQMVELQKNEIGDLNSCLEQKVSELHESLEDLKQTQNYLVQTEKMAALGGLVAGVSHEINTPVGVGVTTASYLKDKTEWIENLYEKGVITHKALKEYLKNAAESTEIILANMGRAAELINSFKQIAVDQSCDSLRVFKIHEYINEILMSISSKFKKTPYKIEVVCPEEFEINSFPGAISQILTNLLMNSLIHGFDGLDHGVINIKITKSDETALLSYEDTGHGITNENLTRIFDPFFTTKRGQGGSGLGLQIVYNLVTQTLCGKISCNSAPGEGVRFDLEFPIDLDKLDPITE